MKKNICRAAAVIGKSGPGVATDAGLGQLDRKEFFFVLHIFVSIIIICEILKKTTVKIVKTS